MTLLKAAFAVPGKITNLTGGTIYDRRVIEELRAGGTELLHIELTGRFPMQSESETEAAMAQLAAVPEDVPLIVDGLAFGALENVATIKAPLFPFVHHPLAEERGLAEEVRTHLYHTERRNLAHAVHVLVPSPHTKALLTQGYGLDSEDITIARPGTDRSNLRPAPVSPPLVLAVGIQLPRKGHDVLLRALSRITDLEWRAVIAGKALDTQYASDLKTLQADLGLTHRVEIAGEVARPALEALYAQASLFTLATRYEGYGMVFDEALAHGLPIVASGVGAVADTVPTAAGLVVPPDDPDAFAHALRGMLSDPDLMRTKAKAATTAGAALPTWSDTAATISAALSSKTR